MTTRSEAFKGAEHAARNKDGSTEKRWTIQYEMECQGFKYDSSKGDSDLENAYTPMKIDIYQSNVDPTKYLSVEAGASVANIKVPDTDYVGVRSWKVNVDLTSNPFALDSRAAQAEIRNHGFYIHGVSTR
ncbi:hypothetical protein GCN78_16975 [Janthinobacterium rivuli]|uniref:hypothetical protein n=1 Tax=Janthinobacterium sp. FT68W TaxID=2654255 RepID=UPI001264FBD6|nr:hypothetical protein [Janthinobacterium sp. FT68W]KAB8049584.1 hypothetical protein GCN78_16975 [Janthinobacterium sp. FT68W]